MSSIKFPDHLSIITDEPFGERPLHFTGRCRDEIIKSYEERDFTLTKAGDVVSPPYTPDTGSRIRLTFSSEGVCVGAELLVGKS